MISAMAGAWVVTAMTLAAAGREPVLVVARPVVDLHAAAAADATVVSQAIYGWNVRVVEEGAGGAWLRVRTADDYTGWVERSALADLGGRSYPGVDHWVQVDTLFAPLYAEPTVTAHAPLLVVPFETMLRTAGEGVAVEGEVWARVLLVDGRTAYLKHAGVREGGGPLGVAATVELAKRFVGLPYLWGGVSAYGFDCSGLMQMLGRQRGLSMPRDARPQSEWSGSEPVERKDLQPGDLLYFGPQAEKVNHTGMYLGGGEFLHATSRGRPGVQVSRLDENPWKWQFVKARRVK